ncbi:MAG: hypothetical protein JXA13_02970 [Anaerolineales bacterium]|nr:hypothetical protein [Anaerolineales bacterium]
MPAVDVLTLGHAAYDLTFAVPWHPGPDEKSQASQLVYSGGGPAANAAVAVARLGGKAAFSGFLSDDLWGTLHMQELEAEGLLTEWIVRGPAPTPLSVILAKPDGRRSLVNYKELSFPLPAKSLDYTTLEPKLLLFDGHEPNLSLEWVEFAQRKGIPTMLDAGSVHTGTQALANKVDYLVCSEKFSRQWTEQTDTGSALSQLASLAPWVVITLGSSGLVWTCQDGSGQIPAFPVAAVDTTGAGDCFHGALAASLVLGRAWLEALRYASAAAALCCMRLGARPALPTHKDVLTLLSED